MGKGNYDLEPVKACRDTVYESSLEALTDIAEIGLDAFLTDGVLKELPVFGFAYKLGKGFMSIRDVMSAKRIIVFAQQVQLNNVNCTVLQEHIQDLHDDPERLNKEMEVILDNLEKQTAYTKAKILGNFYFHFLHHEITWDGFQLFADITNSVSIYDFDMLSDLFEKKRYLDIDRFDQAAAKRLDRCSLIDYFNGMVVSSEAFNGEQIRARINCVGENFYTLGLKTALQIDFIPTDKA